MARRSLFNLAKNALNRVLGRRSLPARPTPPIPPGPVIPPPVIKGPPQPIPTPSRGAEPSPGELRDIAAVQETYDDIQLLGRDAGHDEGGIDAVMTKMRRVKSSNVWGYYYEIEGGYHQKVGVHRGKRAGLLYVTFLAAAPKGGKRPSSAGPTYVYFDVPFAKWEQFQKASDESAGRAVWDYLRVRGTHWQHQHRYRLAQAQGDYVPRKATSRGFQQRHLVSPNAQKVPNATWSALSRLQRSESPRIRKYAMTMRALLLQEQGIRKSTLPARALVNRAKPNRGEPKRGTK